MPLKEETLQRQLERAEARLQEAGADLDAAGKRRSPVYRNANADVRQIKRRMKRLNATRSLDEELKSKKSGESES